MTEPAPAVPPPLPLAQTLDIISSVPRWKILRELADGGSLMIGELATKTGVNQSVISRNVAYLRAAGVVISRRTRLYELAPQFLADRTNRTLDFGWCLLRLNTTGPTT